MAILDLLGRRWTLRLLWELRGDPVPTFRALQQRCDGVSSSVLTDRLTELRAAAILEKTSGGYQLIDQGRALLDTLAPLEQWAAAWQPAPSEP
ncbi:helix-turn-helix domain-containing protein [Actinoplanes sp. NPDC051470]|uniref:winged helix-turn-helix transcriptional regulator n=1 Tax=Actinoplanes sp. NPDC051470 TaxID=3157224 RepID=UPI0034468B26